MSKGNLQQRSPKYLLIPEDKQPALFLTFQGEIPFEIINIILAIGYQLEISSRLWVGHMSTSLYSLMVPSGADPCRPCACCFSLCELMRVNHVDLVCLLFFCPLSELCSTLQTCTKSRQKLHNPRQRNRPIPSAGNFTPKLKNTSIFRKKPKM